MPDDVRTSRREQILEVSARLFQRGFRATSLDDVAAEIGLTRPAIYYYFRSKEEILAAIYEQAVGVLIDRASAVLAEKLPADELLRRLVRVHVHTMLEEQPIVKVFFQEKESLGPELSRSVKAKELAFTKMMASFVQAGQRQRVFRGGNAELIVNAILGTLIWLYQWYRPARHSEADIVAIFYEVLAHGLIDGTASLEAKSGPATAARGTSPMRHANKRSARRAHRRSR